MKVQIYISRFNLICYKKISVKNKIDPNPTDERQLMRQKKELHLERLFSNAVNEPAYRPVFLEELLDSDVYCVGHSQQHITDDAIHHRQIKAGEQIFIKSWDDTEFDRIIPFFTSLEKMQLAIDPKESFLRLPARTFMQMTSGAKLVLNPESDAVKVFYPVEVQALLDGNFSLDPEEYVYDEEVEVLLSEPDPYPKYLVQQLRLYFKQRPEVEAAYLAEMLDTNRDAEPVLVIGLVVQDHMSHKDLQQLHRQLGQVAFDSLKEDQRSIDLVHLNEDDVLDGLESYLLDETKPFYSAKHDDQRSIFATLFS